jgi:hypothetical protein
MVNIRFDFEHLTIFSCNEKDEVILKSRDDYHTECLLYVPRPMFIKMVHEWLDSKQHYFNLYDGSFCGVGSVVVDATEVEDGYICSVTSFIKEGDHYKPVTKTVKGFMAQDFYVDMEHG